MKKILFAYLCIASFALVACQKDTPYRGNTYLNPSSPPTSLPSAVAGLWNEDPYYSGDANTYYPSGFINISIDNGALIKMYYTVGPTGPSNCNATEVIKIQLAIGNHTWQAFNVSSNRLIRSGSFTLSSSQCQLVRIL